MACGPARQGKAPPPTTFVARLPSVPRLYLAFAAFMVMGVVFLAPAWGLAAATMAGFDLAALLFLSAMFLTMRRDSADRLRRHAERYDASRPFLLLVAAITIATVVMAVVVELANRSSGDTSTLALAIATLFVAWLFGNTSFALHYAHLHYGSTDPATQSGLDFPGTDAPDFWDFCYFSFVIGMTFQVSDVAVRSGALRRRVVLHGGAAFVFNIAAIALTVNIVGALK